MEQQSMKYGYMYGKKPIGFLTFLGGLEDNSVKFAWYYQWNLETIANQKLNLGGKTLYVTHNLHYRFVRFD